MTPNNARLPLTESEIDEGVSYALEIVAGDPGGKRDRDSALVYLATRSFLFHPEEAAVQDTCDYVSAKFDAGYIPNPSKPTPEYARDRAVLAALMATDRYMLYPKASEIFDKGSKPPELGAPDCYIFQKPGSPGELAIPPFESESWEETHMRAIVPLLIAGGRQVEAESHYQQSGFARYRSLWELQNNIRKSMMTVTHRNNTQHPLVRHPLGSETIRTTDSQFARNIVHYTQLVIRQSSQLSDADLQKVIIENVAAAEIAAQWPLDVQRTDMGILGERYEKKRKQHDIVPTMVKNSDGELRINHLEKPPVRPSMCSGSGPHRTNIPTGHVLPEWLRTDYTPSEPISPIGLLASLSTTILPYTLQKKHRAGLLNQ